MNDKKVLNNEELEKVNGGENFQDDKNIIIVDDDIHGGIIYNNSEPAFKSTECMFGAPAIIK